MQSPSQFPIPLSPLLPMFLFKFQIKSNLFTAIFCLFFLLSSVKDSSAGRQSLSDIGLAPAKAGQNSELSQEFEAISEEVSAMTPTKQPKKKSGSMPGFLESSGDDGAFNGSGLEGILAPPKKQSKSLMDGFFKSSFSDPAQMLQDQNETSDNFIEDSKLTGPMNQWREIAMPLTVYKSKKMAYSFLAGGSDQLQWHSFKGDAYLNRDKESGWTWMINYHFLGGPVATDLPPRLFDFVAGYQKRGQMSDFFSYDVAASVGAYSDFEGSAREGIRFVSHATGILHLNSQTDFIFGADFQDRDDYKLIPVLGLSYRPPSRDWLRYDLIFPNPAIRIAMNDNDQIYFSGRLGGGSYAIEFPDDSEDVLTYRDYRIVVGFNRLEEGESKSLEIGFASSRQIEFRNRPDRQAFEDSFFIQYSWVN